MSNIPPTDAAVRAFVRVIAAAWPHACIVAQASSNPSFLSDWLQANWETLVEAALPRGTYLEVYGEGADITAGSSRVGSPDVAATAAVIIRSQSGVSGITDRLSGATLELPSEGLAFEEFVTLDGTWYARREPFDCVLVETANGPAVFRAEDVLFDLGSPSRG